MRNEMKIYRQNDGENIINKRHERKKDGGE